MKQNKTVRECKKILDEQGIRQDVTIQEYEHLMEGFYLLNEIDISLKRIDKILNPK